jgi:hypothetical protein
MDTITKLVLQQMQLEGDVSRAEDALKEAKERLAQVAEQHLPDAMDEAGVSQFTTSYGYKVTVKSDITASVPKNRMTEIAAELERLNAGDLLTSEVTVSLARGASPELVHNLLVAISEAGCEGIRKQGVNTATLKAWLRAKIAEHVPVDLDLFGAHAFRKSVIKQ